MAFVMLQDTNTPTISDSNILSLGIYCSQERSALDQIQPTRWYGTVQTVRELFCVATVVDGGDFVVNGRIDPPPAASTFILLSHRALIRQPSRVQPSIWTDANELIVGWVSSKSGLSTTAPANPPYTFDQSIPATTLNGAESETVSSTGSFQSSFTGQDAGSAFPGRQAFSRFTAPRLRFLATPALEAQRYRIVEHRREQSRPMVLATSPSRGSRQDVYDRAIARELHFSPTSQSVTVTNANVIGVNFTATVDM